jgi:CHAD domain-containing protein
MGYCFTEHEIEPRGKNGDESIHEVRVAFKKVRALLRLVRTKSPEDVFAKELACYRNADRSIELERLRRIAEALSQETQHTALR